MTTPKLRKITKRDNLAINDTLMRKATMYKIIGLYGIGTQTFAILNKKISETLWKRIPMIQTTTIREEFLAVNIILKQKS